MELSRREQEVYDEAVKILLETEEGTNLNVSHFGKLVEEYGKLLYRLKQYRHEEASSEIRNTEIPDEWGETHFDVLTGIFNKRYLYETLDRRLAEMNRQGDVLSILAVDLDCFKRYNDIYGSSAGDDCLRTIAEMLKFCLFREEDFVARTDGEEFMAVLPKTPESGARLVADRMLEEVRNLQIPHSGNTAADHVTISVGLVTGKKEGAEWTASDFFRRAEGALSQAKSRGRNRYAFLGL